MIPSPTASPTRSARVPLAAVAVLVAVVVLGAPAVLAGVVPAGGVLSGALSGSCAEAGEVHAGLVVDFGTVDMGTARPANTSDCVSDPGANGVTLLAKRFGKSRIRINGSGLICAIDGYPATGCGDQVNGKYRYWSYWKGVGADDKQPPPGVAATKWQYSPVGPAGRTVADGTVDGWHFVEGSASPSDGAPGNSSPAGPCPLTTPTTGPGTTSSTAGGSGGSGGGGSGGSGGGSGGGGSGNQATPTSDGSSSDSSSDLSGDTPVTAADGSVIDPDLSTGGATDPGTGSSTDDLSDAENASDVGGDGSSGGGLPVAAIGVALAVVALGGGAALRFRGRTDE